MAADYSKMIDSFRGIACIISSRKSAESEKCEYVITSANQSYLASVNKLDETFVPNRPYTDYVAYDPNFEALVDTCISSGKISHQYVNADLYKAWLDIYMIPLAEDEDGNGYCLFTYEMNFESDSEKMINISAQTAYMVLKTCIKFRETDDFKATLDSVVKDIRHQCESDGCAIILIDQDKEMIDITSYDHSENNPFASKDEDVFFKPEFYEIVKNWRNIMGGTNCFIVPNKDELKEVERIDVNWYRSLIYSGVENVILYPLRTGENLYGYTFATNFNSDKTPFIREIMELNSFVLSAEAERFRMRQKLEKLSRIDMLTGVLNRNAMNRRVKELEAAGKETAGGLGIVFVDVNGLKSVNDFQGHNEGDQMLVNVSSKIKTVYESKDIYRVGGDEFLIMVTDMNREEFDARFERLKSLSRMKGEPSFAVGAHFDDNRENIRNTMKIADQNMYRDKAEYYESNPDMNRRRRG